MLTFLALAGLAHAQDVQPGLFLPGAVEVDALDGSIGGGVLCASSGACGPVLQGHLALRRWLVVQGQVPVLTEETFTDAPLTVAVRLDLLDLKIVRFAAFGLWGGSSQWDRAFFGLDGATGGLAGEIRIIDRFAVDAAVPLVRVPSDLEAEAGFAAMDASEVGLSVGLGEHMRVRGGVTALSLEASWRYERSLFYGELGAVLGTREDAPALIGRAQAGLQF